MSRDSLEGLLAQLLERVLRERLRLPSEALAKIKPCLLEVPKEEAFGDISTSAALKLASVLRRPPREIAQELTACLSQEIPQSDLSNLIEKVDIAGAGFVNFHLSREYLYSLLKEITRLKDSPLSYPKKQKKVLVEFVSANPTGPLSVAHGRQAVVGDALSNILEFLGYDVTREYYLNDWGNQINILGNSIYLRLEELKGKKIEYPQDYYQGAYIIDLARELLAEPVDNNLTDKCRQHGVKRILEIIRAELKDFRVYFDSWFSQAELERSGNIDTAISFLKEKGFIYQQEGATWFSSTKFGDDKDRVVVKSDGSYTYLAPDIAYHQDKFNRGYNWLINLWGPDHHGYIPRLKAAVCALGRPSSALDVIIVQLATLHKEGQVVSMSTRKGEYITLREVIEEVGVDAARYFFVMRKTDSHLDFDLELAKKQSSENPVYYIQYAHARISNILANSGISLDKLPEADPTLLKEKEELELLKRIAKFEHNLKVVELQLDPYCLTVYLQELAESFHRFYDACRVLVDDVPLKSSRLYLILGCKNIISLGLKLLGVKAPEKM